MEQPPQGKRRVLLPLSLWLVLVLLLLVGLAQTHRGPPVCARVPSGRYWSEAGAGLPRVPVFDIFVISRAPRDTRALVAAMLGRCLPTGPANEGPLRQQWLLFQESSDTPFDVRIAPDKHHSVDHHQDDLILDVSVEWSGCRGRATVTHYPEGYGKTDPSLGFPPPEAHFDLEGGCGPRGPSVATP